MDKQLFNAMLKKRGITQAEFAEKIGVSRVSLQNRLNGKVDWCLKEVRTAEKLLKLTEQDVRAIFFA